jgi:hypothetical protein
MAMPGSGWEGPAERDGSGSGEGPTAIFTKPGPTVVQTS